MAQGKKTGTARTAAGGEVRRNAVETARAEERWQVVGEGKPPRKRQRKYRYVDELVRLQFELIKLQEWVRKEELRVVVVFEGRDAAGKGGAIKRISESLNPRFCRIVALSTPTERERGQWYFQRYVAQLPARGEIVLFDRSWYNRAGVEHVMGFCTSDEYKEFLRACPLFEEMLVRSGIKLIKYWFSVNDDEQERRFIERMQNPIKRWKLSPMDVQSRERWVEYSKAKDKMLDYTDSKHAPWFVVDADDKKSARLNCIAHLLRQIDYKDLRPVDIELPPRQTDNGYKRPKKSSQKWVPKIYAAP
jgi:polyphosphate kinase 2